MDKPDKLVFSDESTYSVGWGEILISIVFVTFGATTLLIISKASLAEMVLPCGALSVGMFGFLGLFGIVACGHRFGEKRAINRMFAGEIWECWKFPSSTWQALVEAESNRISPKDEGLKAYVGAVYSSIFGVIFAVILIAVGMFAVEESEVKTMMWMIAVIVFLLFLGIGLFQPIVARYKAYRYRCKSLRVAEPRVWFAPDGIYHEILGYTSLKELRKVTDRTKSRKVIQFTVTVSTESYDSLETISFRVPPGCEERSSRLVLRYRQERLHK